MKYKLILADDEEEVLESIHRNLDWNKYGFEVAGTFLNGRDVLEFLETQETDLVITDIRMPFMDGIELSKHISERYPQIKVIIISGYGDFNYAKEAISCRVMDYILKPINAEELEEVLQRAHETLEQELKQRKNIDFLRARYLESLPVIRENLLNRLVEGNLHGEDIKEQLEKNGISIGAASCFTAVLIQWDKTEGQTEVMDERYVSVYIRHLIQERFGSLYQYAAFYSKKGECVIFGMEEREQIGKILLRFGGIAKESKRVMGLCLAIGIGKLKESLLEVRYSFEEAGEALLYRKMEKDSQLIYMEDVDISRQEIVLFDDESREMLFSAMKFGDSEEIHGALKKIYAQLEEQNMSVNACQAWMASMLNTLLLFIKQYTPMAEGTFDGTFDFRRALGEYKDMKAFLDWIEGRCQYLGAYISRERSSKNQNMMDVAKAYIQKEFGRPDISLEMTAEQIGLTPAYFSGLFKKETGESFVEYLTRLRLEEAKRALDETEEKIYAIAEKTGYMDAGYFSHVFKKKYGISPIQYRRQRK